MSIPWIFCAVIGPSNVSFVGKADEGINARKMGYFIGRQSTVTAILNLVQEFGAVLIKAPPQVTLLVCALDVGACIANVSCCCVCNYAVREDQPVAVTKQQRSAAWLPERHVCVNGERIVGRHVPVC